MPDASQNPSAGPLVRLQTWAAQALGPATARLLGDPQAGERILERMADGLDGEDAVLAEAHGWITRNRFVADEFAAFFVLDLKKMGKLSMSATSRLRRFLDTGDLVGSVFGDLWPDLAGLTFESRAQFRSLLGQRMQWKATDYSRHFTAKRRREDRRVAQQPEELEDLTTHDGDALAGSIRKEELEALVLILLRMPSRDKDILTRSLKGQSLHQIAHGLGLSYEAARKAQSRAIGKARELAAARDAARRDRTATPPIL